MPSELVRTVLLHNPSAADDIPVDDRIHDAETYLVSLRRCKNARVPVMRLPDEMLARIFGFFTGAQRAMPKRVSRPPTWLAVTHVCHRWRVVALSFPNLWSDIITDNRHWTAEMLSRSQHASLVLVFHYTPQSQDLYLRAIADLSRIRVLGLMISDLQDVVSPLLQYPAPLLEKVALRSIDMEFSLVDSVLFQGTNPKLQDLSLMNCRVPPTSPLFHSGLVSLKMHRLSPANRPTMTELAHMLSATTGLQYLSLSDCLPLIDPIDVSLDAHLSSLASEDRVHLPHIKALYLESNLALSLPYFTANISVPVDAQFSLTHCGSLADPQNAMAGAAVALALRYHLRNAGGSERAKCASFPSLHLADTDGQSATLSLGSYSRKDEPEDPAEPMTSRDTRWQPNILVYIQWMTDDAFVTQMEAFIAMSCHSLPSLELDTVCIWSDRLVTGEHWRSAFQTFSNVKNVIVAGDAVHGLAQAFMGGPEHLFPRLTHLTIEKADFSSLEEGQNSLLFVNLLNGLKIRNSEGEVVRLERLGLEQCDTTPAEVEQLDACTSCGEVDWDGHTDGTGFALYDDWPTYQAPESIWEDDGDLTQFHVP